MGVFTRSEDKESESAPPWPAILSCALGAGAITIAVAAYFLARGDGDMVVTGLAMVLVGALVITAIAAGVATVSRGRNATVLSVAGLLFSLGAAGMTAAFVAPIFLQKVAALDFGGTDLREAGTIEPIPVNPQARTWEKDVRPIFEKWHRRQLIDTYKSVGSRNARWDAAALEFLEDHIRVKLGMPGRATSEEMQWKGHALLAVNCDDPMVVALTGVYETQVPAAVERLRASLNRLRESNYPRIVAFFAAVHLAAIDDQNRDSIDRQSVELLREALIEPAYQGDEWLIFQHQLVQDQEDYFERRGSEIAVALEKIGTVPESVRCVLRGSAAVEAAWEARGRGYAHTVTDPGWRGFSENLEIAATELARAWELDPRNYIATAEMMSVGLGSGGYQVMRKWFDAGVRERLDYWPMYASMLWGLRPRWHGSHQHMIDFGRQCVSTGRFDTRVPLVLMQAVRDVASEWDLPDEFFAERRYYDELREMLEAYLSAPDRPESERFYRSHYAIIAYKSRAYEDARLQLDAIGHQLDPHVVKDWEVTPEELLGKTLAFAGPAAELLQQAEEAMAQFDSEKAARLFQQAMTEHRLEGAGMEYVRGQAAAAVIEQELATAKWVHFLPPQDFAGWRAHLGEFAVLDDGALEVRVGMNGFLIESLARVGPDFEVEGIIEVASTSNGAFQAGIVAGYPEPKNRWYSFRLKNNKREGEIAALSYRFQSPFYQTSAPLSATNTFNLQSRQGRVTVHVNDALIFQEQEIKKGLVAEAFARVGFGGFYNQNEVVLRYRDVRLRRLDVKTAE